MWAGTRFFEGNVFSKLLAPKKHLFPEMLIKLLHSPGHPRNGRISVAKLMSPKAHYFAGTRKNLKPDSKLIIPIAQSGCSQTVFLNPIKDSPGICAYYPQGVSPRPRWIHERSGNLLFVPFRYAGELSGKEMTFPKRLVISGQDQGQCGYLKSQSPFTFNEIPRYVFRFLRQE